MSIEYRTEELISKIKSKANNRAKKVPMNF